MVWHVPVDAVQLQCMRLRLMWHAIPNWAQIVHWRMRAATTTCCVMHGLSPPPPIPVAPSPPPPFLAHWLSAGQAEPDHDRQQEKLRNLATTSTALARTPARSADPSTAAANPSGSASHPPTQASAATLDERRPRGAANRNSNGHAAGAGAGANHRVHWQSQTGASATPVTGVHHAVLHYCIVHVRHAGNTTCSGWEAAPRRLAMRHHTSVTVSAYTYTRDATAAAPIW